MVGALMLRLYGSDDLFPDNSRESHRPFESVNYVTCHDGFTLYDAVAYNEKSELANGHGNTDGTSDNLSWNCGWEGDDERARGGDGARKRQAKTFFCLLVPGQRSAHVCRRGRIPPDAAGEQQSVQPG